MITVHRRPEGARTKRARGTSTIAGDTPVPGIKRKMLKRLPEEERIRLELAGRH